VERLAKRGHAEAGNSANHLSQTLEETMEEKAREIIRTSLKKQGTGLEAFRSFKTGHPSKVLLAKELRERTTVTMAWIAQELNAGVPLTLWKALWKRSAKSDNTLD
jgi:hypothetical protein